MLTVQLTLRPRTVAAPVDTLFQPTHQAVGDLLDVCRILKVLPRARHLRQSERGCASQAHHGNGEHRHGYHDLDERESPRARRSSQNFSEGGGGNRAPHKPVGENDLRVTRLAAPEGGVNAAGVKQRSVRVLVICTPCH
ncbi:MAG TPA: hypothetical protein VLJ83_10700 [Gemmatimonadaceae bacterium]|nr:hypothetical protein [Gemmatimonadaceae bacterium]